MSKKKRGQSEAVIVLAMHGAPPLDFPQAELAEFLGLHARLGRGEGRLPDEAEARFKELEARVRAWPRTVQNDPFYAGSLELAQHLRQESGLEVILGFNEFCAPPLDEALDQAAGRQAEKIIVVTPMMTRGGEHSAVDIPEAVRRAQERRPASKFIYAWPFATEDIARFLAAQTSRFL
jgi:sirohydrochlorin cobaltochelatase